MFGVNYVKMQLDAANSAHEQNPFENLLCIFSICGNLPELDSFLYSFPFLDIGS